LVAVCHHLTCQGESARINLALPRFELRLTEVRG
jgi:hypothetical protein